MQADDTSEIVTTRVLPFAREAVFNALRDPALLARWWGPKDFRNTFRQHEFRPGGQWLFTMHGPDGKDYPNQSVYREIEAPSRIVLEHQSAEHFVMTITLAEDGASRTRVEWRMRFDSAQVREQLAHVIVPANEQNLDRLTAVLSSSST